MGTAVVDMQYPVMSSGQYPAPSFSAQSTGLLTTSTTGPIMTTSASPPASYPSTPSSPRSAQASPTGYKPRPEETKAPEEKTINYEELKMKIAYKKFERECIMEFDGDTVLCRVCGDKASGFHYGVHACEGCKGFFRRSIQQKIQYRPCLKNQQCNIMRVNRNRCQYCRLKKCISVGMSRDAVRFGRVPKKEKAKILEQMQKVNSQSQHMMLSSVLDSETNLAQKIIDAHVSCCEFTRTRFASFYEKAWANPKFINCPAHMACPLNPVPEEEDADKWEDFTDCFTPAIRNVVNFAKSIPGFQVFSQEDQVTLLKAGTFEVLLVHLSCLFDQKSNTMLFANGKFYKRTPLSVTNSAGFLLDSMFDFAERMNVLRLTDEEMALFSAIVIVAADRPGLRNLEHIERVQSRVSAALQQLMKTNHPEDPAAYAKLLTKIPDLRTLNTLHSEKLLGITVPASAAPQDGPREEKPRIDPKPACPFSSASPSQPSLPLPPHLPAYPPPPGASKLDGAPVVPHRLPLESGQREVVLHTSMGTFHRAGSPPAARGSTASSPDPLELDLPQQPDSPKPSPPPLMPIPEGPKVMTEPAYPGPGESRKRPLNGLDNEMHCKMAKMYNLWEYDMRSNRSNSLSSNSSLESADSAYRSAPGTPRSMLARSPYPEPKPEEWPAERAPKEAAGGDSVLKTALAMPPLVAQHTWFHQPAEPPRPGQEEPPKLNNLLEISRRAAQAAMSAQPRLDAPPPANSAPFLPPYPHPAAAAAMMYQYNQFAAMQQYAALEASRSERSVSETTTPLNLTTKSPPTTPSPAMPLPHIKTEPM